MIPHQSSLSSTVAVAVQLELCEKCGRGALEFVDERPHPLLGIAGKTLVTLRCNAPDCGACVVKST
jgi:hypothetical protein